MLRANRNIAFKIVGDGPIRAFLRRQISDRGLNESVELIDPVPHHDLPSLLAQADIFVSHAIATPDWEEYFGVLNIEAMACELPCILTPCGGVPYVIRESGIAKFVGERDISAMRNLVLELIDNPEMRHKLGTKAREYVKQHYDVSVIAKTYDRMIQTGLSRYSETK